MNPSKSEAQRAFELHYLQQMKELKKAEKLHTLEAVEFYVSDALSECDYVKNNLEVSELNLEYIYESVCFVISSIESAKKELKKMQDLINDDEF